MQFSQFSKLSAFVAVAEHRHFAKAAAQVGISPSALTKTIRALEEHLNIRLLNRTSRSVSLTAAGEELLHHLQPVMHAMNDTLDAMNEFRDNPRGRLRLSVARSVAPLIIGPLLPAFFKEHPDIALEIVTDDSEVDIVHEQVDAGIRIGEWIDKDSTQPNGIGMGPTICRRSSKMMEGGCGPIGLPPYGALFQFYDPCSLIKRGGGWSGLRAEQTNCDEHFYPQLLINQD